MASPAAGCPVLVERERELMVLHRVAEAVQAGVAQVVVLTGEAGAGKSRLAAEILGSLGEPWRVEVARRAGSDRQFLASLPTDSAGASPEDELGAAWAASLSTSSVPLAVLIEDAHELDPSVIRSLATAVEILGRRPVLALVTFRTDDRAVAARALTDLVRHPCVIEVAVGPLTATGVAAMAAALGRAMRSAIVEDVCRRSGGNAFFTEELLLASDAGPSWTLTETVLHRVGAVAPEGRRVAELLAVAATTVPRGVVERIDPVGAVGIDALVAGGLALICGDDVGLRHELVGEILRTHLPSGAKRARHAALAQALLDCGAPAGQVAGHWLAAGDEAAAARSALVAADEAMSARAYTTASDFFAIALSNPPDDPLAHAVVLDHAAVAAGWAGALDTAMIRATLADARYREGGEAWRAVAMWLNPTLRHLPKPALEVASSVGEDVPSLLAASEEANRGHDHEAAAVLAREALVQSRRPDSDATWESEAAYRLVRAGHLAEGSAVLDRLLAVATAMGDLTMVGRTAAVLAETAMAVGEIGRAFDLHHRALQAAEQSNTSTWGINVGLAVLWACRGDFGESQRYIDRAVAGGQPFAIEFAELPATWIDLERGELERAAERLRRMSAVRAVGVATFTATVLLTDARWHHRIGDLPGALRLLDEADAVTGDVFEVTRPDRLVLRARVASGVGDASMISAARRDLDELVVRGGGTGLRAGSAWAEGLWASQVGQRRDACRCLQAAAETHERSGRRVMAAEAWCDMADAASDDRDLRTLALRRIADLAETCGLVWIANQIATQFPASDDDLGWTPQLEVLTPRQREIAILVATGLSNRQVADRLFLSEHTVRNQLVPIFSALGISRRAELAALLARSERLPS